MVVSARKVGAAFGLVEVDEVALMQEWLGVHHEMRGWYKSSGNSLLVELRYERITST
jgi:hypothetical protein